MESGDKREVEDADDSYDGNANKRVKWNEKDNLEMKIDALAKDMKDFKSMVQKLQAGVEVEAKTNKLDFEIEAHENINVDVKIYLILAKCKTIDDIDENIEPLSIVKEL